MYGYQPPAARRLAQLPGQYADGGFVQRLKQIAGMDPERNARIAEYRAQAEREKQAAYQPPASPAPQPQPQSAISGYNGMSAAERRMKEQGLKDGGMVRGPGTGTSDSIETEAEPGTFIMPADSTKALGKSALEKLAAVPVKLSNGEFEFPPEQVMALGAAMLKLLKDTTHKPVNGEDGGQPDDETGEGPAHEMAEAMPGGQEDDAEEGMGYRPADRMAQMPPMMFADGGLVDNNITRVGNSYSGGNVGGGVSINGQAPGGTVSTSSWTSPAPAPAPAPAPTIVATNTVAPAAPAASPAPAPAAPMGWAERNAQRSNQVTASSIMDSPERRMAQAALAPPPPPAPAAAPAPAQPVAGFQPAAQRMGTVPPVGQTSLGYQPRRFADGGMVEDDLQKRLMQIPSSDPVGWTGGGGGSGVGGGAGGVTGSWDDERAQRLAQLPSGDGNETRAAFGFYPQLAGGQRTSYATDQKLRSGVVATGPNTFEPAVNPAPPAPPAPVGGGDGRRMGATQDPRSLTYAGSPAPAPAQSSGGALGRAAAMASNLPAPTPAPQPGGPASTQNEAAANALSRRGAADAMAQMPAPQQTTVQAPMVRHSGNDWQARNDLRNALVSASSITNNGGRFDQTRGRNPAALAYQSALATDNALQASEPGLAAAAMKENSETNRSAMRERGLAAQALDSERGAMDRTLITERGNNTRAGITALAGIEEARIKNSENKPLNDVQAKALQFGTRMLNSGAELDKLAAGGVSQPGLIKRGADAVGLGAAANWTQSGAQQQVEQAQRDFINAVLRRESGAAIADSEFANARQQYFPQPGDSPEVIAQKRKNRDLATAGVLAEVPNSSQRVSQLMTTVDKNQPAQQGSAQAQSVTTQEAYAALPSGSRFVAPDGKVRIKP